MHVENKQQIAGLATELGMTMGLTAAGLLFLGLWVGKQIDTLLGTDPYATVILLISGVIIGQVAIIRLAVRTRDYFNQTEAPDSIFHGLGHGLGTAAKALGLVALPIVLRVPGGWLDRLLGTKFAFTLVFVVVGLVVGVAGLLSIVESMRVRVSDEVADE